MHKRLFLCGLFFFGLLAVQAIWAQSENNNSRMPNRVYNVDSIIAYGKTFLGKPYRYRIEQDVILDCSGYLRHIFAKYNIVLGVSSEDISKDVKPIDLEHVQSGDLLFFKGRNLKSNRIGHVSMIVDNTKDTMQIMHSCSRGILIEPYQSSQYYKDRFLFAGRVFAEADEADDAAKADGLAISRKAAKPKTLKILGVGDMMLGTNFPNRSHLPPNDGRDLLKPVASVIQSADIAFGNLEGVLMTGEGQPKSCKDPEKCYVFKSPNHYAKYFKEAGFDILSIANNHSGDFGLEGRKSTADLLDEAELEYAGWDQYPYTIFEKDGITYGFCAFAPNSGTVKINDYKNARELVSLLELNCDIVIVSFHGGAEGNDKNRISRKKERFLGEDRGNPYEFARVVIDAGADVVFGHGPHVPRAVDLYKGRFVAYSLGNFATYGRFNLKGNAGYAPIAEVEVDREGKFIRGKIHSAIQIGEGGPVIDHNYKAVKEIKKLTELDIPETPLKVSETGELTIAP